MRRRLKRSSLKKGDKIKIYNNITGQSIISRVMESKYNTIEVEDFSYKFDNRTLANVIQGGFMKPHLEIIPMDIIDILNENKIPYNIDQDESVIFAATMDGMLLSEILSKSLSVMVTGRFKIK